jgi:hypothetical protein
VVGLEEVMVVVIWVGGVVAGVKGAKGALAVEEEEGGMVVVEVVVGWVAAAVVQLQYINNTVIMRLHVYHNIPASAWEPVMQIATGRLRLRSVTAHWHGRQRSHSSCCPCCPGATEDPAHNVL